MTSRTAKIVALDLICSTQDRLIEKLFEGIGFNMTDTKRIEKELNIIFDQLGKRSFNLSKHSIDVLNQNTIERRGQ